MKSEKVLFVDDEPNVLKSYERALRNESYGILLAKNGADALSLLETSPVELLVTDFRMSEMNGIELVEQVRRKYPHIHCVILSGYADEETIRRALELGSIKRFLLKPIDNAELKKEISALMAEASHHSSY